jgi:hypothetical protein
MKKFEYKVLTISAMHLSKKTFQAELDEKFRRWGDQGWDLIKMEPVNSTGFFHYGAYTDKFIVVFKGKSRNRQHLVWARETLNERVGRCMLFVGQHRIPLVSPNICSSCATFI